MEKPDKPDKPIPSLSPRGSVTATPGYKDNDKVHGRRVRESRRPDGVDRLVLESLSNPASPIGKLG